jgi:hypothetical protein
MAILLQSLESLFTKTETIAKCFLRRQNNPEKWRILGSILRKMKYYVQQVRMEHPNKTKRRKVSFIGHILSWNCLLKYGIEGKMVGEE